MFSLCATQRGRLAPCAKLRRTDVRSRQFAVACQLCELGRECQLCELLWILVVARQSRMGIGHIQLCIVPNQILGNSRSCQTLTSDARQFALASSHKDRKEEPVPIPFVFGSFPSLCWPLRLGVLVRLCERLPFVVVCASATLRDTILSLARSLHSLKPQRWPNGCSLASGNTKLAQTTAPWAESPCFFQLMGNPHKQGVLAFAIEQTRKSSTVQTWQGYPSLLY